MVLFAPNIFILNSLKSTAQLTKDIQDKATRFLQSGELFHKICDGQRMCEITRWFVCCCFEASSFDFGRCHLGFGEPEVTIFGREGVA